jgi:hypothetical protein
VGLLLSACSSDDPTSTGQSEGTSQSATEVPGAAEPQAGEIPFALFGGNIPAKGWRLTEAVQPSAEGRDVFGEITPGLEWFAEWDGPSGAYLSLTMRRLSLADLTTREPLAHAESGAIAGRPASWGDDAGGDEASGILRIEWGSTWTLELRGSESVDTLRTFAPRLRSATQKEWQAEGGQVGCAPFAEQCKAD